MDAAAPYFSQQTGNGKMVKATYVPSLLQAAIKVHKQAKMPNIVRSDDFMTAVGQSGVLSDEGEVEHVHVVVNEWKKNIMPARHPDTVST